MALLAQNNQPKKAVKNLSLEEAFTVHQELSKKKDKSSHELAHLLTVAQVLEQELTLAKSGEPAKSKIETLEKPKADSPILDLTQPAEPVLSPQIGKDLANWWKAIERYDLILKEIKKLAKDKHVTNPAYFIMEFQSLNMEKGGAKIGELSAADNMGTDIRNDIGNALSGFNTVAGSSTKNGVPTPKEIAAMKKFMETIDQIEAFLKYESSLSGKGPEGTPIMGKGTIKNLQDAIDSIKGMFDKAGDANHWGNPKEMAHQILADVMYAKATGQFSPELKGLRNNFNTMNQTVSAFSTSTNTELQFQSQQFKQEMGVEEADIQSAMQAISTMVRNSRSS